MSGEFHGGFDGAPPRPLPREMVLASAGSGKTYHLSSRLIGLLASGERPDAIWASTFTRKAAAEILDRVLLRLARGALDEEEAAELAGAAWLDDGVPPPAGFLDRAHCGRLLTGLVRSLHRANIETLDAFFVQVASTFSEELRIPPGWRLVDGPAEDRMRSEALESVLAMEDASVMAELVRIMAKGEVRRGVHRHLLEQVEKLLLLHREVDPSVVRAWTPVFEGLPTDTGESGPEAGERCQKLAEEILGTEAPRTKAGKADTRWERELIRLADAVRNRDWKAFFEKGLGKKLVESGRVIPWAEVEFYKSSPDAELASLLDQAVEMARLEFGREIIRQGRALGRMAARYREAFEKSQVTTGGFRFGDITHLLRESSVMGASDSLYFRLDARIRHILLDEFQDTSLAQWEVLDPLVREILSGGDSERVAVLVADPKQSIYGWRGARPALVDDVRRRLGLVHRQLPKSYRSGPVILDTVQKVFHGLDRNSVVGEMNGGPEVARAWQEDFFDQEASDKGQPGYACLVVGPGMEGRGGVQPGILNHAADYVGRLHDQEPRASIGVLVRTNKVVSYLIAALRRRQIPASGEGGTPLTDTAPVNAVLALLRMADHPGDRLSRYHVAQTPVGEVVGYTNFQAGAEAKGLAWRLRGRLLREGYGATLAALRRKLEGSCHERERARLLQLVELGFRWDEQRTLRPGDFVRFVEKERVEDPSGARVRVMTVHQAKGLQFDVVVLPHLYPSLEEQGGNDPVVPFWHEDTGRVVRVFPAADKATRALLPELQAAEAQNRALRLRDEFSTLYVAMTRVRYALHMVVPADGPKGPGSSRSSARILREALAPDEPAHTPGEILFRDGRENWYQALSPADFGGSASTETVSGSGVAPAEPVALRPSPGPRTRNLARRSPSSLEGGDVLDLASLLRRDTRAMAFLRGNVVHAWCEAMEWIDDGIPEDATLLATAREVAPDLDPPTVHRWISDFKVWMESPAIRMALGRAGYPAGARVERELPFLHRIENGILQGYVDRLVLEEEGGRVTGAHVLDFKTDLLDGDNPRAMEEKVKFYRPQILAYMEAVAGRFGVDPSAVSGALLFLRAGVVERIRAPDRTFNSQGA